MVDSAYTEGEPTREAPSSFSLVLLDIIDVPRPFSKAAWIGTDDKHSTWKKKFRGREADKTNS